MTDNGKERIDDLQCNGMRLIQRSDLYKFNSDSVLLANYARVQKDGAVADFGCGSGVIALLVTAKNRVSKAFGVELCEDMARLAERNVALNNMDDKIEIIRGDMADAPKLLGKESVDTVVCNPPYFRRGSGAPKADAHETAARHEDGCRLEDIVAAAEGVLKFGGRFYIVLKCDRLSEALTCMSRATLEPKRLALVRPKASKPPDVFIVEAKKGAASGLAVEVITILDEDGELSKRACELYGKDKDGGKFA